MITEEQQEDLISLMNDITAIVFNTATFENLQYALLLSNMLFTILFSTDHTANIQLDFSKVLLFFKKVNENNINKLRNEVLNGILIRTQVTEDIIENREYDKDHMAIIEDNIKNILYYYMILLYIDKIDIVTVYAKNKKVITSTGIK